MHVTLFSDFDSLRPFSEDWDRLATGNPFRSWAWNAAWWKAYGQHGPDGRARLWILGVHDDQNRLRGIAPWYQYHSKTKGAVISFLGSGEVCSDYVGIMATPGDESTVVDLIADWLLDPIECASVASSTSTQPHPLGRWDLLQFDGIDDQDPLMNLFAERIQSEHRLKFHRRPGLSCWRLELAPTEEAFLASKKKNFRKRFRRCRQSLEDARNLRVKIPGNLEELACYIEILIDLHQRRQNYLGKPGCYASNRFERFQRAVLPELFCRGQATITMLFKEDKPIAADYHLFGAGIVYSYQSGLDPYYLELGPGNLIHGELVHRYVNQGMLAIDFLRGNEGYKKHWQAEPRAMSVWHVAAPHWSARCRNLFRRAGEELKATAKRGLRQMTSK